MKKVFKFSDGKRDDARVFESIKNEIRKYVKREKKKPLSDKKTMYWDFDCKIGESSTNNKIVIYEELIKELDLIKVSAKEECYIEILAKEVAKPIKKEEEVQE